MNLQCEELIQALTRGDMTAEERERKQQALKQVQQKYLAIYVARSVIIQPFVLIIVSFGFL